jgi:anti-sigma factor RsiW
VARELSRRELDELLGAYALDAVDEDEREQVEAYLDRTPEARSLVAEYRETATLLADSGTAPPGCGSASSRRSRKPPARAPLPKGVAA